MYRDDIRPEHQERWNKGIDSVMAGNGDGAIFIYKSLANDGCATALSQIGRIYEHGLAGTKQDFGEAAMWFKRSVETIDDLQSHLALARIYLQDKNLDPTRELVLYHLNLLADNDVMGGYFGLGLVHEFGIGVEVCKKEAADWYRKAEALGHVGARLSRIKNVFLAKPVSYFFPLLLTSLTYHWMYFFTKNAHRLEMWDDPNEGVFVQT